jgi:O-antigen ligase
MTRIAPLLLFTTVALAPLLFGSTDPATVAAWCVVLGIALIFASPRALQKIHLALLAGIGVIVVAYLFVLHEQLSAHPWIAMPKPIWQMAADNLGVALEPSASTVRNQPFYALGPPLASLLALICGIIVGADRSRARQLLQVIAWSGTAYAIFGIPWTLLEPGKVLWRDNPSISRVLSATFVNRNTAAVYFGSCAVVWLLLICEHVRRNLPSHGFSWKEISTRLEISVSRTTVLWLTMIALCLVAMLMTASRAGIVLSLLALVIAFSLYVGRDSPRRSGMMLALLISGAVAFLVLQTLGQGAVVRFDVERLADGGRLETYRSVWHMIWQEPWFGTGLGTFAWSYPAYRNANISLWGIWNKAHSTPLEMAAELGVPLAALILIACLVALLVLFHGARTRRRGVIVPISALSVALMAFLHSMVDFSLQIPGLSIIVFALIGAGLSQSFRTRRVRRVPRAWRRAGRAHLDPVNGRQLPQPDPVQIIGSKEKIDYKL